MDTLKNDEVLQQGTETLKNNKQVRTRYNSRNKKLDEIKKFSIKSENKIANINNFEEVEDLDGKKSDEVNFFRDSETKINPFDFSKINVPHFENDEASSQQYYASGTKNQIHIVLKKDQNKDQKEMLKLQQSLQKNAKRSKTQQNDQNIQMLQSIAKQNPNLKIDFNQNINGLLNDLISNNRDIIQRNGNLNINGIIIKGAPSMGTKFNPNFRDSHHSSKPQSRGLTQGNVLQIATQALAIIQNLETQVRKKKKKRSLKQKEIFNKNMHDSLEDYQNSQGLGFNITIKSRRTPDQNSLMMQGYRKQASLKIKSQDTQKQNFSDYNNNVQQNQQYQKQKEANQEKKIIKIQGGGQDGQDKVTLNINLKQNKDNHNSKLYTQFSQSPKRMLRKNSHTKNAAIDSLGHLSLDQKQNQENDYIKDQNQLGQQQVVQKEKSSTTQQSIELNLKTLKIKSLSQQIQEGDNFRNKSSDVQFHQNQDYVQQDKNYEYKYKRNKDGSVANIESKEYYGNNKIIKSRKPSSSVEKFSEFQYQNQKNEQCDDKNNKLYLKQRLTNMKKTNKKQIYTSTIQPQNIALRDDSFKQVRKGQPIKDFLKKIAHLDVNDKKFNSVNSMSPFRLKNAVLSGSIQKAGSLDQDSLEEDLKVKSISNANTLNINLVGPHHQIHQLIMKSKITKKHIIRKPQVTNKATTMIHKNNSKSTVQDVESRLKNISREILSNKNTNLLINSKGSDNKIKTEMIENTMSGQYHSNRDHIFKETQVSNQIKQLKSFQHSKHDNFTKSDRISQRQKDENQNQNQNLRDQEELNLSSKSQKIKNLSGKISARKVNTKRVTVASNQNKQKTNEKQLVKVLSEGDSIDNQNLKSSFGITQTSNKINEDLIQFAIDNKEENIKETQINTQILNQNEQNAVVEQTKQNDINSQTQNKLNHFDDELEPNNIRVIQLTSQIYEQDQPNQLQSENFIMQQINIKQGTSNEYTKAHPSERRDPNLKVLLNENEKFEIFKRLKTLIPKKSKKVIMNKNVFVDIDEINYSEISSNANLLDQSEILQMQINDTQKTVVNNSSDCNNIQKQKENQKIMNNNNIIDETKLIPFENMQVKKMNKKHMNKMVESMPQSSEITKIIGNESNSRLNTIHSKNQIHESANQQYNESITASAKIKQTSFAQYNIEDQNQNQLIVDQEAQTIKNNENFNNLYSDQNSNQENNSLLLSVNQIKEQQNNRNKPYLQKNLIQDSFQLKINQQNLIYSYSSSEQQKQMQIKKSVRKCLETSESLKIDEFIDQIKANKEKQNQSMNKLQSQENEKESKVQSQRTNSKQNEVISVEQFNPIHQVYVKRRHSNDFTDVVSKNSYKILSIYPTVNDRNSQPDIDQIQMQSKVIRANQFTSKSNQFQIHASLNAEIINRQNESDFKQSKN